MSINKLIVALFSPFLILLIYTLVIWLPVHTIHESQCLKAGYPKTNTDVFLNGYCVTLDGNIAIKVKSLNDL